MLFLRRAASGTQAAGALTQICTKTRPPTQKSPDLGLRYSWTLDSCPTPGRSSFL